MHPGLLEQARAQRGVFITRDALAHGLEPRDLTRLVALGVIVRVRKAAFVLAEVLEAANPEHALALRTLAVMRGRQGAVAAGASALAIHGLPLWGIPFTEITLRGAVRRVQRRSGLVVLPHPQGDGVVTVVDGVSVATIPYAVAQLCAAHGRRPAIVALDAALHAKRCRSDALREFDLTTRGFTARQQRDVQVVCDSADPRCESVGETRTRLLLQSLGYAPRSQVALSDEDGFVARVDFFVDNAVIVEFDGLMKYEGFEGRAALAAEKRREDRLRSLGFAVVRLTWADLDQPERVAQLLRRAMSRIRRPAAEQSAS